MHRGQSSGDGRHQRVGPVGKLVRGLASGIGLASESYQHHKDKKAAAKAGPANSTDGSAAVAEQHVPIEDQAHMSQQMDEAVWELDEAQDQLTDHGPTSSGNAQVEIPALADAFIRNHPPPPYHQDENEEEGGLDLPVVITQRRPGSRTRGFVRAYSPLLADVGIDQATFLDFLDDLNKSVEPSPWIQTINLASLAGHAVPEPFTVLISLAIKKVADTSSELHSRSKTNQFLDKVNESFFAPRGLIALVMTWQPSKRDEMLTMSEFNMTSSISQAAQREKRKRFESSSGESSFEWPETAPLVFPALDELADATGEGGEAKKQSAVKRGGDFVGQYMDKRARAKWAGENPDSAMANTAEKEQFASRYADPNHPASSGDPIALLTGGFLQSGFGGGLRAGRAGGRGESRGGLLGGRRGRQAGGDDGGRHGRGRLGGSERRSGLLRGSGGVGTGIGPVSLIKGAKKLLQDDVLYLMIVERPTEEQMAEALRNANLSG
ncbi:hypothetical protein PG995_014525 [Apiospora arundinis]